MPHIAIGGIKVKNAFRLIEFTLYVAPSLRQARAAPGCLHAEVFPADGYYFSLTAWQSPADMKRYARSRPHLYAMRRASVLSSASRFHHFQAETIPTPADALSRWRLAGAAEPAILPAKQALEQTWPQIHDGAQ